MTLRVGSKYQPPELHRIDIDTVGFTTNPKMWFKMATVVHLANTRKTTLVFCVILFIILLSCFVLFCFAYGSRQIVNLMMIKYPTQSSHRPGLYNYDYAFDQNTVYSLQILLSLSTSITESDRRLSVAAHQFNDILCLVYTFWNSLQWSIHDAFLHYK